MKQYAILIKSNKCFYLCGGSSIKMGLTNCNTQIWVSTTSGVWKPYNLYINTLIILRLLQGVYNHLTRLQQGRKPCKSMVFSTLHDTRLLQPKISIWVKGGHGFTKPCKCCFTNRMRLLKIFVVTVKGCNCIVYVGNDLYQLITSC